MDCRPPGSSVYGIFQARILEWVAISYSRGSSWPRDRTLIPCISCVGTKQKRPVFLYHCAANINSLQFFNMWYGPNIDMFKSNPMCMCTHTHTYARTRPQPCWEESLITNKSPLLLIWSGLAKLSLRNEAPLNTGIGEIGIGEIRCGAHIFHQATVLSLCFFPYSQLPL